MLEQPMMEKLLAMRLQGMAEALKTQEQDPAKVRKLSAELNQAMLDEERRKVRLRLGC